MTLILTLMTAYIYTILQFFYFYDIFQPGFFASNKPCLTMYSCYMNVINYGIRMGGGMGEVTSYVSESSSRFEGKYMYNLTFFFLINMLALNMVFGIIIDSFGALREEETEREVYMNSYCMVCSIHKAEFEAAGVSFYRHIQVDHNIEDYIAFMIRLLINQKNLSYDLDFSIYQLLLSQNVSWFPNKSTKYLGRRCLTSRERLG